MAELSVYELWAYDATKALAIAIEKVGDTNIGFEKENAARNLTDLEALGADAQLQSLVYQIINVIDNGERVVGFWIEEKGMRRDLNSKNPNSNSIVNANFKAIISPGDIASPPKGWAILTNGIKLRIGVPVKDRFPDFVMVS
ncbi:unnamed protein product [Ilex paraguariensis]|uniref:Uncharacterized protein n=1 Tax=Ilex paraguariensis TaxID=185542 RepID=A0ABC8R7K7_9AQUA